MTVLATSFAIWKYHQRHNSSGVLLEALRKAHPGFVAAHCRLLRRLPVDGPRATHRILAAIGRWHPSHAVLCGMGSSPYLKIEGLAGIDGARQLSDVDVRSLAKGLSSTRLSRFAGRYVCNETYYRVLKAIRARRLKLGCLFVHVPLLDEKNIGPITADFFEILSRLNRAKA
jgi:pyroglutamyl-peptidase